MRVSASCSTACDDGSANESESSSGRSTLRWKGTASAPSDGGVKMAYSSASLGWRGDAPGAAARTGCCFQQRAGSASLKWKVTHAVSPAGHLNERATISREFCEMLAPVLAAALASL